jgi:hypothetical protein
MPKGDIVLITFPFNKIAKLDKSLAKKGYLAS